MASTIIIPFLPPNHNPKPHLKFSTSTSASPNPTHSIPPRNLTHLLRLSTQTQNLNLGKSIHSIILKSQHYNDHTRLLNSLISVYLKFNRLIDARNAFDEMPSPDIASFASLISAYSKIGREIDAVLLFDQMRQLGIFPNGFCFVALLTACIRNSNCELGTQIHALAVKAGSCDCVYVANAVMGMYVSCGFFEDALDVFDKMNERDVSSWNTVISAMVKDCRYREAFELFREMKMEGEFGDRFSISTLLSAMSQGFSLEEGEAVHAYALKLGLDFDLSVGNALIRLYTQLSDIEKVIGVFDRMPEKDVISWTGMLNGFMEFGFIESAVDIFEKMPKRNIVSYNALLAGFCKNGEGLRGLRLFQQILKDGPKISDFTVTSVVNTCAMVGERKKSEQIHGFVIKMGFTSNAWVEAALLDMCAKCDRVEDAEKIYDRKIQKGSFPITWTSLISARARNGQPEEALSLFQSGLKRDDLMDVIDEVTLATVLGVCGSLGFAVMGEQIHGFAYKSNVVGDIGVGNAIVSMYSKCGNLENALNFFNQMHRHDLVSWNGLINSYLNYRKGDEALNAWSKMELLGQKPDHITFLLIISACKFTTSNSVSTCQNLFLSMLSSYNIKPSLEHYSAMVDVLSCWGHFDEAKNLIISMPFKPDASIWRALLENCKKHSNISLGRQAIQKLLTLEPKDPSSYTLISNLYSASGRWHCSNKLRQEMRLNGLKKIPAKSWIIHQNTVHSFYGRDKSHSQSKDIYSGLEVLILECMKAGYEPDTSFVLQEAEEYQKRHFLFYHSAKLAVAYGVLVARPGEVVRVMKNVRLCGDCHEFFKVVSSVTGRRILVRDGSGFHRFEGGECICGDCW
ncbi:uncharacterized protein A4U43_C07F32860 [Asparagus officinalis]|uniref:DYW domain-containing protein n=1 Tax=Asparagus officinalis TaxID=4686 RepID=A0A5P1ELW7_ASPOF|nr:pentatricopeptide repeat-containing protein At5g03800 [Asparagus officinalis]ONK65040.1 uncharacterized protein A4U43_C07F32860 [Asparagus officinalis]